MTQPLSRLADRILDELSKINLCLQRLFKAWQSFQTSENDLFLDSVALNIQGAYNGLENIFILIAKEIDGSCPSDGNWHQLLLEQMATEIKGRRPAVISEYSLRALSPLRGARHVVRHIYPFEIDDTRIEQTVQLIEPVFQQVNSELSAFAEFLRMSAE